MSVKVCPTCGAAQPVEHARFCLECGAPLAASSVPFQASQPINGGASRPMPDGASLPVGGMSQPSGSLPAPDALAEMGALPGPGSLPVTPAFGTVDAAPPIMPVAGMAIPALPATDEMPSEEAVAATADAGDADEGSDDAAGDTGSLGYVIVQMDAPVHLIDEAATMSQPQVVYMDAPVHIMDEAATMPPISLPTGSMPTGSSPAISLPGSTSSPARSFPPSVPRYSGPLTAAGMPSAPVVGYPPAASSPGYVSSPISGSTPGAVPKLAAVIGQQLTSAARGIIVRAIIFAGIIFGLPIALVAIMNAQNVIDPEVGTPLLQVFDAFSLYLILPVAVLSLASSFWYTLLRLSQPPTVTQLWGEAFLACVVTLLAPTFLFSSSIRLDSLIGYTTYTPLAAGTAPLQAVPFDIQTATQVTPYILGILTLIIAIGTAVGTGLGKGLWARVQRTMRPGTIWNDRLIVFGSAAGVLMVLAGLEKPILRSFGHTDVSVPINGHAFGTIHLFYNVILLALPLIGAIAMPIVARFMLAQRLRRG
jgi:hypothetical protein